MPNIHASIIDEALYTKSQLAKALSRRERWIEENIQYPSDPSRPSQPLCRCDACGRDFPFPEPVRCPHCGSLEIDVVPGCPWKRIGGEITFSGRQLRLWAEQTASAPVKDTWGKYLEKLAAARLESV